MARPKTSLLRRILVQTDCAFWCIHDHLDVLAYLGLPTLAALRHERTRARRDLAHLGLPRPGRFLDRGCARPVPGALASSPRCRCPARSSPGRRLVERRPRSESASPGAGAARAGFWGFWSAWACSGWFRSCFSASRSSGSGRRTCLTPLVALFEDERRIFRRSRRILREDFGVS